MDGIDVGGASVDMSDTDRVNDIGIGVGSVTGIEGGIGMDNVDGFGNGGMLMMNSLWFMFLFIPSLFYSPQYRKAVLIIYSITTIFSIIGMIVGTIGLMMVMGDEEDFDEGGGDATRWEKRAARKAKQPPKKAPPKPGTKTVHGA